MNLKFIFRRDWGFKMLVFLLVFINVLSVLFADLKFSRLTRMLTVVLFLLFYIAARQFKNLWVGLALFCFILRDVFFQFYEHSWGFKGYMLAGGLCYALILLECRPKLSLKTLKPGYLFLASLLIAATTLFLYFLIGKLSLPFTDAFTVFLFYLYGALMVILGLTAITYNNKYNSTRSFRYTLLVFCFIFSDIAALFAYSFGFEFFYVFARLFFVTAIGLIISYGLNYEIAREEMYQYEMLNKKH